MHRLLRDQPLVSPDDRLFTRQSLPHGHVEAVLGTMRKLGLDSVLASQPCPERNLVLAMIAERLLHPCSKLATTRLWHNTTLAEELGVPQATEDDLYAAMDWRRTRQPRIEDAPYAPAPAGLADCYMRLGLWAFCHSQTP